MLGGNVCKGLYSALLADGQALNSQPHSSCGLLRQMEISILPLIVAGVAVSR